MSSGGTVGFVLVEQSEKGKEAAAIKADSAFQAPRRMMAIPSTVTITTMAEKRRENDKAMAPSMAVRRIDDPSVVLTSAEKVEHKRGRKPKIQAPLPSIREAVFRRLGEAAMVNADEKKTIQSLPSVLAERTELIPMAFESARATPLQGQLAVPFEGVVIRSLNSKDKARIAEVQAPTWVLYSGTGTNAQEYPLPHDFPVKTHMIGVGISIERVQAAHVSKMIRTGIIDSAVFAMPKTEDQEHGKQWRHAGKVVTIAHCNSNGQVVPTAEVYGHEFKDSKEDQPNYRVGYIILDGLGERRHLETFVNSEAQAVSAAMSMMGNGAVSVTVESRMADKDGVVKELDPKRYPLEAGAQSERRKAWNFQGTSATLMRGGFAALQPDTTADEVIPSRKRGPICWKPDYNRTTRWQKNHVTSKATFSAG